MKGIMIYETPLWGDEEKTVYTQEVTNASYKLSQVGCTDITCYLEGTATKGPVTKAVCSKDDTYDFETGALISLMKRCGLEKSAKAYAEIFDDTAYGDALIERDKLREENKRLTNVSEGFYKFNNRLIGEIDQKNHEIASLKEGIEKLKDSCDKYFKEVESLVIKKNELIEENENLKLDCEKLQHGDNDMMFCGGRQNGKQYTLLVDLFKKIDQKKVDEAYKEAYNTTLPVWQKEALRQAYEIRKESKEKIDLPRTLDINGTVYRKSIQIKDFGEEITKLTVDSLIEQSRAFRQKCVDEWVKPPTKREEMWEKIFALHKKNDVIIVVKKEDIDAFLHEIENRIPEIRWASWQKIFEAKNTIKDIYEALMTCDRIYFRLRKENELSYSSDPDIYQYKDLEHISYLPPMRWDLFRKVD